MTLPTDPENYCCLQVSCNTEAPLSYLPARLLGAHCSSDPLRAIRKALAFGGGCPRTRF